LPAEVKKSFDAMVEAEAAFKADLEKLLKTEGHMPEDKFLVMSRKGKRSMGTATGADSSLRSRAISASPRRPRASRFPRSRSALAGQRRHPDQQGPVTSAQSKTKRRTPQGDVEVGGEETGSPLQAGAAT
jgi:hypothetical protein